MLPVQHPVLITHLWLSLNGAVMWVCVAGSLQAAAGVCEAGAELWHAAAAGGGRVVRVHRLCVGPLHQAAESPGQLPGRSSLRAHSSVTHSPVSHVA